MISYATNVEICEVSLPRCNYDLGGVHTGGEILDPCAKCDGERVCGPFGHYCLNCQPFMKIQCNICETPRFKCCC